MALESVTRLLKIKSLETYRRHWICDQDSWWIVRINLGSRDWSMKSSCSGEVVHWSKLAEGSISRMIKLVGSYKWSKNIKKTFSQRERWHILLWNKSCHYDGETHISALRDTQTHTHTQNTYFMKRRNWDHIIERDS